MSRASRKVASPRVVCVEDLRPLARRRVPKAVFDYLDGGAEGEVTLRENCRAFEDVTFRPRHAVAFSQCDLKTRVLGFDLALRFLRAAEIPFLPNILSHPGWLIGFLLDGGIRALPNVVIPGKGPMPLLDVNAALASSAVTWADFSWIRDCWRGPIVVKGVLTGDDARRAVDEGAAAISVSNHGGRQLDGVPASLRALPEVVAAINGQVEILMDGGILRGTDIVKALCLGARAVLCGRAYAYGLAASGEAGIARAIEILRADLDRTLRLLGCSSVAALDRSYVNVPKSWEGC